MSFVIFEGDFIPSKVEVAGVERQNGEAEIPLENKYLIISATPQYSKYCCK